MKTHKIHSKINWHIPKQRPAMAIPFGRFPAVAIPTIPKIIAAKVTSEIGLQQNPAIPQTKAATETPLALFSCISLIIALPLQNVLLILTFFDKEINIFLKNNHHIANLVHNMLYYNIDYAFF